MVSPFLKQTWTIMGVLTNMFGQGMFLSYSSILLPALQDPNGDLKLDLTTASWIISIMGIACLPGYWISSLMMDIYGRRLAHGILLIPAIAGWLCIFFAKSIYLMFIGRALNGFAGGGLSSLGCIIIGEYSSPEYRGVFMAIKTAAFGFGCMAMHILGHFYDWKATILFSMIPLIISLLITYTWQESPSWLVYKNQYEECEKSFYWLRGKSKESKKEIEHLLRAQKEKLYNQTITRNLCKKIVFFFKKFTRKDFLKPALIIVFSKILLEACGRHIFAAFAMQFTEGLTGKKTGTLYYTFGSDIVITVSSMFSSVLFRYIKRRTLLFSTGFAALLVLFTANGFLYLVSIDVFSSERTFIPATLFVIYFILTNLACIQMPFTLLGELFPLVHRGAGICIAGFTTSLCMFTTMQITPYLLINIKLFGTLTVYGTAMGICLIVLWFVLPETKDRTLQEIEDFFTYGKFKSGSEIDEEVNAKMVPAEIKILESKKHVKVYTEDKNNSFFNNIDG